MSAAARRRRERHLREVRAAARERFRARRVEEALTGMKRCPACKGSGIGYLSACGFCDGTGRVDYPDWVLRR